MTTHIRIGERTYRVELPAEGPPLVDGITIAVEARMLQPGVLSLLHTGSDGVARSYRAVADAAADDPAILLDGQRIPFAVTDPRSLRAATAGAADSGPKALKSPMPGRIVRVLVVAGETVEQGQGCVVIEAMKMQNELKAPRAGTVAQLQAQAGETVGAGAVLLVVE